MILSSKERAYKIWLFWPPATKSNEVRLDLTSPSESGNGDGQIQSYLTGCGFAKVRMTADKKKVPFIWVAISGDDGWNDQYEFFFLFLQFDIGVHVIKQLRSNEAL